MGRNGRYMRRNPETALPILRIPCCESRQRQTNVNNRRNDRWEEGGASYAAKTIPCRKAQPSMWICGPFPESQESANSVAATSDPIRAISSSFAKVVTTLPVSIAFARSCQISLRIMLDKNTIAIRNVLAGAGPCLGFSCQRQLLPRSIDRAESFA